MKYLFIKPGISSSGMTLFFSESFSTIFPSDLFLFGRSEFIIRQKVFGLFLLFSSEFKI